MIPAVACALCPVSSPHVHDVEYPTLARWLASSHGKSVVLLLRLKRRGSDSFAHRFDACLGFLADDIGARREANRERQQPVPGLTTWSLTAL